MSTATATTGWQLVYNTYEPEQEKLREALCTVGNGYLGTRGAFEGARADDTHYPGTYLAGVYDKAASDVHGKTIYNDDLVNCPNWLRMDIRIGSDKYRNLLTLKVLKYRQTLDMKDAVLERRFTVEDRRGRRTRVVSRRLASMADQHAAGLSVSITPVNYSDRVSVRSVLDGTVVNDNVARYRNLSNTHLVPVSQGYNEGILNLSVETMQSHIEISMCARTTVYSGRKVLKVKRSDSMKPGLASEQITFEVSAGKTYRVEKLVSIFTSRDENLASPEDSANAKMGQLTTFDNLLKQHVEEWTRLWYISDITIGGDDFSQLVARLHTYHLLTTASPHNVHIDAGIPARGLHGEAYRGHIFWDDLFILPFYYRRFPDIARSALLYRYRRLDAARNYAHENGFEGAMYPWQTSSDGREETQVIHYNPVSGNWDPDLSCRQRHVSIAVFYNFWEYYTSTGDTQFLTRYGAEVMLEIARFWSSIAVQSKKDKRYHIRGVMGPDEFHEKYPGASEGGIDDNAYTNLMVVWLLERALQLVKMLPPKVVKRLLMRTSFESEDLARWRDITKRMYMPIADDGLISQYEGYLKLKEIDWEHYRKKYTNIHRMDRILKSEGDSPDYYMVAKQADTLMLFYLLSPKDVARLLKGLGYKVKATESWLRKNYSFYEEHTSHGSTLSKIVHAAISRDMGMGWEKMWDWLQQALESDINDTQGGTTPEGIHTGVMAGTINIIVRVIAGVHISENSIDITPKLPKHWTNLSFKLQLRGQIYSFDITHERVNVIADTKSDSPLTISVARPRA